MKILENKLILLIHILIIIVMISASPVSCNNMKNQSKTQININLPIDNEKEAIEYAKKDNDVNKYINAQNDNGFKIGFWAVFNKNEDYWAVGVFPVGVKDYWYEIHIKPDGQIISKQKGGI